MFECLRVAGRVTAGSVQKNTTAKGTHLRFTMGHFVEGGTANGHELLPVEYVNDPRVIATEDCFVSINATTEVDLVGQCASETVAGRYWSSSGGQSDFARGAMYSRDGRAFVVLPSTAAGGSVSRIRASLSAGSMVTTMKNTVDHIVTEYGVADMRGRSISQRARALIAIADPAFRDQLTADAKALGYL